jgi:hypothetical protein
MESKYTTVLDAAVPQFPPVPLIVVLAVPVLLLAFAHVAKARDWRSSRGPLKPFLWVVYLSYAPMVLYQYWTLWTSQTSAQNATQVSVEAGRIDGPVVNQSPDGLFVETRQRFAVNGVGFEYRHQSLRYLDFLLPRADLVTLPQVQHAHVRVTYRDEGDVRQLLRIEIATRDLDAHD